MQSFLSKLGLIGNWAYVVIFLAAYLESAAFMGLIVPGETVVVLAGFLSSHGYLDLGDCILVISLGAVLGDSTGYSLGKVMGKGYFRTHERFLLLKRKHLDRAGSYFETHGGKTVFWGRFAGILRALAPFVAGMSSMPYARFFLFNAAGGVAWAVVFTCLGYVAGESWQQVERWSGRAGLFVLFMLLVTAGFGYLYRKLADNQAQIRGWFARVSASPVVSAFIHRHPALTGYVIRRVSPGYYLGLHLTVGLVISAVFLWIFGGITEDILTGDPFVAVDEWIVGKVLYFRTPLADRTMEALTHLGGGVFLAVCSLLVAGYLAARRRCASAVVLAVAMAGGSVLVLVLKAVIQRPRPPEGEPLAQVIGWSFPSGHAMMSVVFYGMLAYLFTMRTSSARLWAFSVSLAGFLVFVIGLSRLYLGVHYLSDVIAGLAGGLFWLSICITGIEIYRVRMQSQTGPAGNGARQEG